MDGIRESTHAQVQRDVDVHLAPAAWSDSEKLVLAARILAGAGHCSRQAASLPEPYRLDRRASLTTDGHPESGPSAQFPVPRHARKVV